MFRFTMIVPVLCALLYLSVAPCDLEARCGGASGRQGTLFNRRTRQVANTRVVVRAAYVAPVVQEQRQSVTVRARSSGGCPGGVCPINR